MTLKIDVNDLYSAEAQAAFLPTEQDLQTWYREVEQRLDGDYHVSVTYVTPEYMQELNGQYRGKDYATNVLSFEFMGDEHEAQAFGFTELGDLIICPPVLEREAKEQEKPLEHHWTHICLHGLLHLLGYDHIEPEDAVEMEGKEKELLAQLGIPDPYRDDEKIRESLE
ncbi:rRNA maturation RNase YbeY [Psittacicella melopsittaci]|uniref:Endoribonuclease YbeY n=1 Tax=Psittacicella melopsittaci TaxID=2028576 RepID=A0A3A1Y9F8_9GAMM|nr:rRNA maturation RNase YbeY [Psittacicella melopsittaci]RIY33956.1 rRNA maturation RNase YbeY [Psittacicella melopsittaci]